MNAKKMGQSFWGNSDADLILCNRKNKIYLTLTKKKIKKWTSFIVM